MATKDRRSECLEPIAEFSQSAPEMRLILVQDSRLETVFSDLIQKSPAGFFLLEREKDGVVFCGQRQSQSQHLPLRPAEEWGLREMDYFHICVGLSSSQFELPPEWARRARYVAFQKFHHDVGVVVPVISFSGGPQAVSGE